MQRLQFDKTFTSRWRTYLFQVAAATVYLAVALVLVDSLANLAVGAAIAASTFLTFCLPNSVMAQPRRTLGGHVVALVVTLALSPLIHDPIFPGLLDNSIAVDLMAALAVGLTMLGMAVTNTEHAPGAGTALGLSFTVWSIEAAVAVIVMVLLLVAVQILGRGRLVNLL